MFCVAATIFVFTPEFAEDTEDRVSSCRFGSGCHDGSIACGISGEVHGSDVGRDLKPAVLAARCAEGTGCRSQGPEVRAGTAYDFRIGGAEAGMVWLLTLDSQPSTDFG
jgi:hypothetical protein